jgi:hypothetical protein
LWDTKQKAFQVKAGQPVEMDVPEADSKIITEKLRKRGEPATKENIIKYYIMGRARGG